MFKTEASKFIHYRTYSKWMEELKRRENWGTDSVPRVIDFLIEERGNLVPAKVFNKIKEGMLNFDVMTSMRLVWSAGIAAKSDNTCIYNCAFLPLDSIESFAECLYILMCGTGVGFSVENKYVEKLPIVNPIGMTYYLYTVNDDKKGWADSIKYLMTNLYEGNKVDFDYSLLRPKGARLLTMGGRSSGPEPLMLLHNFIKETFNKAQGRKLTSLECHDIANQIAETSTVGGVRRSSQISLSDFDDNNMRDAKVWPFPQRRSMANNSAVYLEKPEAITFLQEWGSLAKSGTGERGIFNLGSVKQQIPKRRDSTKVAGTNPCGEIVLRPYQFCNLSSVVIRPDDDLDSLLEKVETATWIGVIQSSFTYFPYLRPIWKENCEEERLLGVSLSGQMDNPKLLTPDVLKALKSRAQKVAKKASEKLGINYSTAITCVKPEGTSSQLVYSSSGLHVWYSKHFIRRYRISSTDPLLKLLKAQGVKVKPEVGQKEPNVNTYVIEFPMMAPKGALTKDQVTAIDQLEHYKKLQEYWCEHNASCTIYIKPDEWFEVGNWVYKNWDIVNGLSFLPDDGGKYELAPLETITKEKYEELVDKFPIIDYTQLSKYETEDQTEGSKEIACTGGICDI